ncbi:YihY/virulence factor BrkB family protein [Arthrobacter sp. NEB 688]|uniref:YihY/virulence factor BrkB family protein n=1 Tax=Arthrobacter sp. NEB 688 TaxID=904039 RepID=UPI001566511C|nr:YihY/virulence factor BrkB family protein [Arthrobacter sp. NEB 688]QKE84643.1 YihY/virulence factor BrkB family protein [Arthrobacter sp. NEB 688]
MTDAKRRVRRALAQVPGALAVARLTVVTTRICLRYRVTGLASEAGFFALLSLPPLVLGLFGGLGYLGGALGPDTVDEVRVAILRYATQFLTPQVIDSVLGPTVDDVLRGGRFDLLSIGFVLSLWSGSRAVNVFVDTISIMYGQSGVRGIIQTRALSFSLYVVALLLGIVTIPLVLLGPTLLGDLLPTAWHPLTLLYWPLVTLLTVGGLTSLYHVSTPHRSPWTRDVPGAVLTLVIWALASFVVRGSIAASLGGTSIYGPLSAPIVILIWLYALAIAVLIGAALNGAIRELWPADERRALHTRLLDRIRHRAVPAPVAPHDPFGDYRRTGETDELDLRSLRTAAQQPLTPLANAAEPAETPASREVLAGSEKDR